MLTEFEIYTLREVLKSKPSSEWAAIGNDDDLARQLVVELSQQMIDIIPKQLAYQTQQRDLAQVEIDRLTTELEGFTNYIGE